MDYTTATAEMLASGMTVFQAGMLGQDEAEHCRKLFDMYRPRGRVIDMGCGVGGVAAGFKKIDPSLDLVCVTNCEAQISLAVSGIPIVLGDLAAAPLPDGEADMVMFNESFGYVPARQALDEAFRLLKPGGRLCIKDFSFAQHTKTIGDCERSWGYAVHDPRALSVYAEHAGFRAVRQWRRLSADFTRWHRFMETYSRADEHRHQPHAGNIRAAVYVFEKPVHQATERPTMLQMLKGDEDATAFCAVLHRALHTWDDLVDGDATVTQAQVNEAFHACLVQIPLNPFYQRHAATLTPLIASGITAWEVANVYERSKDREKWNKAHMLRVQIGAVFVACAEIVGGREWALEVAPAMYDLIQGDTLAQYLDEMEGKHADPQ